MKQYCFCNVISIQHSADNLKEHAHYHSLEITTYIRVNQTSFEKFDDIEECGEAFVAHYQNRYLNDCEEFGGDTRIEHVGDVLFEILFEKWKEQGAFLERFEIGETPLRKYIITHTI